MKKISKILLAVLTLFTINLANIKADEIKVARINDTDYTSLDEAINAASDETTIELLNDAETAGMNLNKNIIIEGNNKTITFNDKGIALWGKKLTFKNTIITMTGVDSTPYCRMELASNLRFQKLRIKFNKFKYDYGWNKCR